MLVIAEEFSCTTFKRVLSTIVNNIGGMQSAELGEGIWEGALAREEEVVDTGAGTEHRKQGGCELQCWKHWIGQDI